MLAVLLVLTNFGMFDEHTDPIEVPDVVRLVLVGWPADIINDCHGLRLVRPDGTITLRRYGTLNVAGRTPTQVERALALQLAPFAEAEGGQVRVTIKDQPRRVCYIIHEGLTPTVERRDLRFARTVQQALGDLDAELFVASITLVRMGRSAQRLPRTAYSLDLQQAVSVRLQAGDLLHIGAP